MKRLPTVSFIIPCFNQAKFLYDAISSVMVSYQGPKEIIVIEDCSTDTTTGRRLEEINRLFPSVKIIYNEKNRGLSAARNTGIDLCSGEYIQFLDADDLLFPRKIDYQMQHITIGNQIDISVTDYLFCDESITTFSKPTTNIGAFELTLDDFLYKWERGLCIPIHTALFKREMFSEIKFDESLTAKEDWLFWCRQAIAKKRIAFLNLFGAAYRQHQSAMTKVKGGEMGRMWIRALLLIDNLLGNEHAAFLSSSLSRFQTHYKNADPQPFQPERDFLKNRDHAETNKKKLFDPNRNIKYRLHKAEKKTFSFVIPVYNHYAFLSECIQSIFDQTYDDFEIICVDDNSSDLRIKEFLGLLEREFPVVKVIYNNINLGVSRTINRGVDTSLGDFIVFLDCDDYISPKALEEVSNQLKKQPDIDYFFSDKIEVDENNSFIRKAIYGGYSKIHQTNDIGNDLLDGMVASHLKVIRKSTILDMGGFDPKLDGVQDYYLAMKIVGKGKFKYIAKPLYYHRQHTNSVTTADTVRQFRNSNIARRKICNEWYKQTKKPKDLSNIFYKENGKYQVIPNKNLENEPVVLFTPQKYSLSQIKSEIRNGRTCIFDARGQSLGEWAYFVREYNSYFDLIVTDDSQVALFLIGYLWDYQILRVVDREVWQDAPVDV